MELKANGLQLGFRKTSWTSKPETEEVFIVEMHASDFRKSKGKCC